MKRRSAISGVSALFLAALVIGLSAYGCEGPGDVPEVPDAGRVVSDSEDLIPPQARNGEPPSEVHDDSEALRDGARVRVFDGMGQPIPRFSLDVPDGQDGRATNNRGDFPWDAVVIAPGYIPLPLGRFSDSQKEWIWRESSDEYLDLYLISQSLFPQCQLVLTPWNGSTDDVIGEVVYATADQRDWEKVDSSYLRGLPASWRDFYLQRFSFFTLGQATILSTHGFDTMSNRVSFHGSREFSIVGAGHLAISLWRIDFARWNKVVEVEPPPSPPHRIEVVFEPREWVEKQIIISDRYDRDLGELVIAQSKPFSGPTVSAHTGRNTFRVPPEEDGTLYIGSEHLGSIYKDYDASKAGEPIEFVFENVPVRISFVNKQTGRAVDGIDRVWIGRRTFRKENGLFTGLVWPKQEELRIAKGEKTAKQDVDFAGVQWGEHRVVRTWIE